MRQSDYSRRRFLQHLGVAGLSTPFLRSFAHAQADGEPKPKLLILAWGSAALVGPRGDSGRGYEGWLPPALHTGSGYAEANAQTLPQILAPLQRHASEIIGIDGLQGSHPAGHQNAAVILSGGGIHNNEREKSGGGDGDFNADSISIDHAIANRIGSRVLGLSYDYTKQVNQLGEGHLSHTQAGREFQPIFSHVEAFNRVFEDVTETNRSPNAGIDRRLSILDAARRDAQRLRNRLPTADRARLDQHLDAIRRLETDMTSDEGAGCGSIDAPETFAHDDPANFPRLVRSFIGTMTQALACGFTRVGYIQAGNLEGNLRPMWPEFGIMVNHSEHAISHKFHGGSGAGAERIGRDEAVRAGIAMQQAYSTFHTELLDALLETPDVDGSPLLRNTVVLQVRAMGKNHGDGTNAGAASLFWTISGGQNLGIRTGRFIRLPPRTRRVNDVHTAIAQAMGVPELADSFGRSSYNNGPLDLT